MAEARPDAPASLARVRVLLLDGRLGPLDYAVPTGLALGPGDLVEVPLGPRRATGIVWDGAPDPALAPARLKPVARRLPVPPLAAPLRRLVEFVADYYLAEAGRVARLALPAAAFLPTPARRLLRPGTLPDTPLRPPARQALAEALLASPLQSPAPLAEWARRLGASPARLKPLVEAGVLLAAGSPDEADAQGAAPRLPPGPALSPAQAQAATALRAAVSQGGFQPFLLDGVTGSGKTEVYFEAIAAALEAGRQTLVLLPEIALTAPWLERFAARFDRAPTVWHSGVKPGERRRAFADLASGRAPVVVGARSAVFLPLPRLALIIVDEAHEAAFKQEDGVFYHGRDVAVVRAREEAVPILLATATPGLETLENVARGRYRRLALPDRFGGARLPDVRQIGRAHV